MKETAVLIGRGSIMIDKTSKTDRHSIKMLYGSMPICGTDLTVQTTMFSAYGHFRVLSKRFRKPHGLKVYLKPK